jgi:hypothetical protein
VHTATLRWSGEDPAPSTGMASHDVQQPAGGGAWQTILAGAPLAATTRWLDERLHAFQVRARDGTGERGWLVGAGSALHPSTGSGQAYDTGMDEPLTMERGGATDSLRGDRSSLLL